MIFLTVLVLVDGMTIMQIKITQVWKLQVHVMLDFPVSPEMHEKIQRVSLLHGRHFKTNHMEI